MLLTSLAIYCKNRPSTNSIFTRGVVLMTETHRQRQLEDLFIAAAALACAENRALFEGYLSNGFDKLLRGEDVFGFDLRLFEYPSFFLQTVLEKSRVSFSLYQADHVQLYTTAVRQYVVSGRALFITCTVGDPQKIRRELEQTYCELLESMTEERFCALFGKNVPYDINEDSDVIVVASKGVIECIGSTHGDSLILKGVASDERRLSAGQYYDVRRYDDAKALFDGVRDAWGEFTPFGYHDEWGLLTEKILTFFQ